MMKKIDAPIITQDGDTIIVTSPFNRPWIEMAKKLGGKWDKSANAWIIPAETETAVREALVTNFGSYEIDHLVTVRLSLRPRKAFYFDGNVFSYSLNRSLIRDGRLQDGVSIIAGAITDLSTPEIGEGTILEVRRVSEKLAKDASGEFVVEIVA